MTTELTPDLQRALTHYALIADVYDQQTRKIESIRQQAIAALHLQPGQTVIDAGCGTGACLPALAKQVGPQGVVIGIEPSWHLLQQAYQRVQDRPNVRLIHSAAQQVELAGQHAHAVLFCYTHDLMQSPAALSRLFSCCEPGARVVATGTQLVPRWLWPVRRIQRFTHRHYITARDSMHLPYGILQAYLQGFQARRVFPWHSYLAVGTVKASHANISTTSH
jgi:ubiquinone/menaquinone biosynthesis C-methylase UbiE